jgi:hypothetical protein
MRQVGIRKTVRSPDSGIAVDVSLLTVDFRTLGFGLCGVGERVE